MADAELFDLGSIEGAPLGADAEGPDPAFLAGVPAGVGAWSPAGFFFEDLATAARAEIFTLGPLIEQGRVAEFFAIPYLAGLPPPPPPPPPLIPPLTAWQRTLRALVYLQFGNSNWAVPTADAIGAGRQEHADATLALRSLFSIDTITDDPENPGYGIGRGLLLDRIGALVGEPRGAATDEEYRPILRAKILVNKSSGGPDELINVFLAAFAGVGAPLMTPGWIAEFTLRLAGVVVDPLLIPALAGLLGAATQAGTRGVLEWSTAPDSALLIVGATTPEQSVSDLASGTVGGAVSGAIAAT